METKDLLLKEKNGFVCNQKFMILQQNIKEMVQQQLDQLQSIFRQFTKLLTTGGYHTCVFYITIYLFFN
jgi:hypothetical protein